MTASHLRLYMLYVASRHNFQWKEVQCSHCGAIVDSEVIVEIKRGSSLESQAGLKFSSSSQVQPGSDLWVTVLGP